MTRIGVAVCSVVGGFLLAVVGVGLLGILNGEPVATQLWWAIFLKYPTRRSDLLLTALPLALAGASTVVWLWSRSSARHA